MRHSANQAEAASLRTHAEELLRKKLANSGCELSVLEPQPLIHELAIYQIELEVQKQKLILTKEESTIASENYIELYDFSPSGYFTLSSKGEIIQRPAGQKCWTKTGRS